MAVITIFVRHTEGCKYAGDEFAKRCDCRKHLRWTKDGKQHRQTAGTRSWAEAEERKRELEDQHAGRSTPKTAANDLQACISVFLQDKTIQGVGDDRLGRYTRELERLRAYCEARGVFTVAGVTRELLTGYAGTWAALYPSTHTRSSVRARTRSFLRYCYEAQWLDRIPSIAVVRVEEEPTLPLTPEEYARLLAAIPGAFPGVVSVPASGKFAGCIRSAVTKNRAQRAEALVRLMRHSGLAIRDAVALRADALTDAHGVHRITAKRQKTGTDVSVPVPPFVAEGLRAVARANSNPEYVFWTGRGEVRTAVSHWQDDFRRLFRLAKVSGGGNMLSHRLRDTFAVDLLEKGVPMEEVSRLLGHTSIRTTEKHYAKWSKGRQDRADALVIGTWATSKEGTAGARKSRAATTA